MPDDGFGENGVVLMIEEESDGNGFVETLDHGFKITRIKGESQGVVDVITGFVRVSESGSKYLYEMVLWVFRELTHLGIVAFLKFLTTTTPTRIVTA